MFADMTKTMHVLLAALLVAAVAAQCPVPPILNAYSDAVFEGQWFEIGKIQTDGGAFFERGCHCTQLQASGKGDGTLTASNICTKDGRVVVANETLTRNATAPGRFVASVPFPFAPAVNYNVMALTDEFAIEYDCFSTIFGTNYCFHLLSRKPTLDAALTAKLVALAGEYQLNPLNLPFNMTGQTGCGYRV